MDMYPRILNPIKSQSFFLFGARGTGKSTFILDFLKESHHLHIDLLKDENEVRFSEHPDDLFQILEAANPQYEWLIIDEIQKIPKLLNVAHRIIESKKIKTRVVLTGSSARKLKTDSINLLAGRAFTNNLYPLTYRELADHFSLPTYLQYGGLPKIYHLVTDEEKKEFLRSYVQTYLKEEIWNEQLVRNLTPFRKFIECASQMNGEIINYSKMARDIGVDTKTAQNYFSVLEDTLVGFQLEAFHTSVRKRLISAPKFYLFDCGVKRALDRTLNLDLASSTYAFGKAFEHFLITQMMAFNQYKRLDYSFFYLKTKDGAEIDLVIDRPGLSLALIEIKSSNRVDNKEMRNLKSFISAFGSKKCEGFCFSLDAYSRKEEHIHYLHWMEGLKLLFHL